MFYALRKLIIVLTLCAGYGAGTILYQQRDHFEPVFQVLNRGWDRAQIAWHARDDSEKIMREWDGDLLRVPAGNVIELRDTGSGQRIQFILLGLEVPPIKGRNPASPRNEDWRKSKEHLENLIGTNRVHLVAFASASPASETGFAFVESRNLNAAMVRSGLARFDREHLQYTTTPIRIQMEDALGEIEKSAPLPGPPGSVQPGTRKAPAE